jgi:V/A-type H+-transporting ATPase subunit I
MKKYSFLVYHREYEKFLHDLQDLGVIHIIEKESGEIENEELKEKHALTKQLKDSIKFLEKRNVEKKDTPGEKNGLQVLHELNDLREDKEHYFQKLTGLKKELSQIAPWGEFKWESIERLKEHGIHTRFFTCPAKKFEDEIKANFYVDEINQISGNIYFVLFDKKDEKSDIDAEEISLPGKSFKQLKADIQSVEEILEKTEKLFDKFAIKYVALLQSLTDRLTAELSFDKVILNSSREADDKLMILEGWVPVDKDNELIQYLNSSFVYFESSKPDESETPPIKLKNNKFAKLYESIGELYTFPDYKELDLTPFFAPFYMLFFGFCLGDAGYGLLITIGSIYGLFKAKPKLKPLLKLGMYLGIATTVMGIIGGTFFGIMLLEVDWIWIQQYKKYMLESDYLMYLAIGLGYIQVLFGMFIKAANKSRMFGFKYAISQLGWNMIVMISIPTWLLGNFEILDQSISNKISLVSLIVGGIPALFYNSPGKNPLLNLGVGIWDTYQTASGLLGDVLSYIRLFALGISSAILGNVFNSLAVDLSPKTIILRQVVMLLILVFGHSLNLFMAALGSFVHPLRLTFVEFYKNAGFSGGGKKYIPFSK